MKAINVAWTKTVSPNFFLPNIIFPLGHNWNIKCNKISQKEWLLPVIWHSAHWIKPHDALEYMDHWTNGLSPICLAKNLTLNIGHFLHRGWLLMGESHKEKPNSAQASWNSPRKKVMMISRKWGVEEVGEGIRRGLNSDLPWYALLKPTSD